MYIIVGLGNPGEEYASTRHNTGRRAEDCISKSGRVKAKFIIPDAWMNKSGLSVAKVITSKKAVQKLIVIHDDLDLPLGALKISYNRSAGGHKGVESIIRALKTEAFIRLRLGISPSTKAGKLKKPKGERTVEKFILGRFSPVEEMALKKVFKRATLAVVTIVEDGLARAMTDFNSIN